MKSLKFTINLVMIKNGNRQGKTLVAHTDTAFKHSFAYNFGSNMNNIQIIIKNRIMILFVFFDLIIYNVILDKGKI